MTSPQVSAGLAVLIARVFSLALAAVQLPIIARLLGPEDFAFVALSIAWSAYFSLVAAESTILGFQRFPGRSSNRSNYLFSRRRIAALSAICAVALLLICAISDQLAFGVAVAGFGLGILVPRFISVAWLMWDRPWSYALSLILSTGVRVVTLLLLLTSGTSAYFAVGCAGAASALAVALVAPRSLGHRISKSQPWPRYFGLALAVASAFFTLSLSVGLLTLPIFAEPSEVGQFAAMTQLSTLTLGSLLSMVLIVVQPRTLRMWETGELRRAQRVLTICCYGTISLGSLSLVLVPLLGQAVVDLVFGPGFYDQNILMAAIAISSLAAVGQFLSNSQSLQIRPSHIRNAAAISAIACTIGAVSGASIAGGYGSASGVATGFMAYVALMWRQSGTPVALLGLCGMLAIACLLPRAWESVIIPMAFICMLTASIYFVAAARGLLQRKARATDDQIS